MTINIEDLTLKQIREIAAIASDMPTAVKSATAPSFHVEGNLRHVIVRARDAGVHYGKLDAYEGRTVWLKESRRLWSWTAKAGIALSGVARNGIIASKSKVDALVESIIILDACEIIDVTADAAKTILGA